MKFKIVTLFIIFFVGSMYAFPSSFLSMSINGVKDVETYKKNLAKLKTEGIHVTMAIRFNLGSSKIANNSKPILNAFISELDNSIDKLDEEFIITVAGHTDNTGSEKSNLVLSRKRAEAVATYMYQYNEGLIKRENFRLLGYGQSRPRDTNKTAEGRRNNRRVEFYIYKHDDRTKKSSWWPF